MDEGVREMQTRWPAKCTCGADVPTGSKVQYDSGLAPPIRTCPTCDPQNAAAPVGRTLALRVVVERTKHSRGDWSAVQVHLDPESAADYAALGLPVVADYPFTASGTLAVRPGDLVELHGTFEMHAKWGPQFKVAVAQPVVSGSLQSLAAFLESLPQIGRVRAEAIIAHFKTRRAVLAALEGGDALCAVAGLNAERAADIHAAYATEGAALRNTHEWLAGLLLGEALTAAVLKRWRAGARAILEGNPYKLMGLAGVGFRRADEIALKTFQVGPQDVRRAVAAVRYLLEEEEQEGHTWTLLEALVGYPKAPWITVSPLFSNVPGVQAPLSQAELPMPVAPPPPAVWILGVVPPLGAVAAAVPIADAENDWMQYVKGSDY